MNKKEVVKDRTIALRVEMIMYEKLLEICLTKSKEQKRNVGVSDVIREMIKNELK